MVAIYSTLGLARRVSDTLREHNLLRLSIAFVLTVVLGAVAWRWVKRRPDRAEVGVALGVAFAFWMVWIRMGDWEERTHLIEYGIVAALIHQALLERANNGRRVPMPAALTVGVTAILGLVDELIQMTLPQRVFDIRDVGFNALAGFMVIAARLAIAPQRQPGWRVWFLWLLAVSIGWGEGVYLGWYTDDEPKTLQSVPDVILAGYSGLVVGAMLIGGLQWLVLRRHVVGAGRWVPANLGAVAVVGAVILGVGVVDRDLGWIVGISLFGTVAGLLQWAVLRRQVPLAGWWVAASTAGWVLGMPFGDLNGPPGLGAVYGAITATTLVWLMRQPSQATQQPEGSPSGPAGAFKP